jgi:hypothetical protein
MRALLALAAAVLLLAVARSASAAPASPAWSIHSVAGPTNFVPGDTSGKEIYKVYITNSGSQATEGSQVTITDTLPSGITPNGTPTGEEYKSSGALSCASTPVQCTYSGVMPAGDILEMDIPVVIESSAERNVTNFVSVAGGGAIASASAENAISATPAPFGINDFSFGVDGFDGTPDVQAGGHPYAITTTLDFNTQQVPGRSIYVPDENVKDVVVDLPLGFVGNPLAAPKCPLSELEEKGAAEEFNIYDCPANTKIGDVTLRSALADGIASSVAGSHSEVPVSSLYNMVPEHGHPAEFSFTIGRVARAHLYASVVHTAAGYVLRVTTPNIPAEFLFPGPQGFVAGVTLTFFGDPASQDGGNPSVPFFTNPMACATSGSVATVHVDTWTREGRVNPDGTPDFSDPSWIPAQSSLPPVIGCNALQFEPTIALTPDSAHADAPTGITVDLKVPQAPNNDFAVATPELKDATVALPQGLALSPSAADGLQGCSDAQIALSSTQPATCPEASQVGTVKVQTPLLADPLEGEVYLGTPNCSPCTNTDAQNGNLIRLFIQAQGSGVVIKLPGTVSVNPGTGQLTATFNENPQLPFDDLTLTFKSGPRAALATPQACGTYTTTSSLTPWSAPDSGPPATPSSSFNITSGCATQFAPSFTAGTSNNQAGTFSPFSVTFSRTDQDQDLSGITVQAPPGLLGVLKSVVECPEPKASQGACGPESLIGHTTTGAGPGTNPFYLGGSVFLTGPYKGAPFGLSIVVPAVAGPFNLGNVIVRAAISVDPHTAQISVTSDPLPQILDGIPLQIKTVNVTIDRPGFMFNPTNCEPLAVGGTITSTGGASAGVSSPFQAANCANLPFKPAFSASTQGKTSKADGASLVVKVAEKPGEANIHKVNLQLPLALPTRLTTLQKACTEAQFNTNPAGCPEGSNIGTATAITPVLSVPLTGPAYLVSHGGAAFPDVVFVLQGQGVQIDLVGNTDIKKGITYSKFETVPDAPISSFETTLPEGPHSALGANGSLCSQKLVMPTAITGQNGRQVTQSTNIVVTGCGKPSIKITKAKIKGNTILVTVTTTQQGTVTVSGNGLKTIKKTLAAGAHQLKVSLTKNGRTARKHHKKTKVKASVKDSNGSSSKTMTLKL